MKLSKQLLIQPNIPDVLETLNTRPKTSQVGGGRTTDKKTKMFDNMLQLSPQPKIR